MSSAASTPTRRTPCSSRSSWPATSCGRSRTTALARLHGQAPADTHVDGQARRQQDTLRAELRRKEAELAGHAVPLVYSGGRRQPQPTFVLLRGEIRRPGREVTPGGLSPVRV